MKLNIVSVVVIVLVLAVASCTGSDEICLSGQMSVTTGLYSNYTSTESVDTDTTITIQPIGIFPRVDTSYSETYTNTLYLPLSMETDSTSFSLVKDGIAEAITFYHVKELAYVSEECGFIFHFTIDSVAYTTSKYISSVELIDDEISYNKGTENVKIYID